MLSQERIIAKLVQVGTKKLSVGAKAYFNNARSLGILVEAYITPGQSTFDSDTLSPVISNHWL